MISHSVVMDDVFVCDSQEYEVNVEEDFQPTTHRQKELDHFTKLAVKESQRWIEAITCDKFKHPDDFIKSLQDGVLLCRLMNGLKRDCIRRINHMKTSVAFLDNLSLFQYACRQNLGLQECQLFDIRDLDDLDVRGTMESEEEIKKETNKRLKNILVTMFWLGRVSRPLRPDTTLNLDSFKHLVDPSHFLTSSVLSSSSSSSPLPLKSPTTPPLPSSPPPPLPASSPPPLLVSDTFHVAQKVHHHQQLIDKVKSTPVKSLESPRTGGGYDDDSREAFLRFTREEFKSGDDWEMKFSEWKSKRRGQVLTPPSSSSSIKGPMSEASSARQTSVVNGDGNTKEETFHAPPPPPPNWKTYPGSCKDPAVNTSANFGLEDVRFFDEDDSENHASCNSQGVEPYQDTSSGSSSSASSFATKQFATFESTAGAIQPGSAEPIEISPGRRLTVESSLTFALLGASPDAVVTDEMNNFDSLLRDEEKFSEIRKSQSLQFLEDFDEVGYEEDEAGGGTSGAASSGRSSSGDGSWLSGSGTVPGDDGVGDGRDGRDKLPRVEKMEVGQETESCNKEISSFKNRTYGADGSDRKKYGDDDDRGNHHSVEENKMKGNLQMDNNSGDFLSELIRLENATRKYDSCVPSLSSKPPIPARDQKSLSVTSHLARSQGKGAINTELNLSHLTANQRTNLKPDPIGTERHVSTAYSGLRAETELDSVKFADVIGQKKSLYFDGLNSDPASKSQSMMDRFAHDLDAILNDEPKVKVTNARRVFDLEGDRKKMEEWNKRTEEKLQVKFERDQDQLKKKLNEDLLKAHQIERMKQMEEVKFLEEEEVIEVKNRRNFAGEERRSKFSKSSLALFEPMPMYASSPAGPSECQSKLGSFKSLTDDWIDRSFHERDICQSVEGRIERGPFSSHLHHAPTSGSSSLTGNEADRTVSDEAFEEPHWMKVVSDKVDKDFAGTPVAKAVLELLPDSLTASNESLQSSQSRSPMPSREDIRREDSQSEHAANEVIEDFVSESKVQPSELTLYKETVATCDGDSRRTPGEIPPVIPERDDSLLVASDILTSRQQVSCLSFDESIAMFTRASPLNKTSVQQSTSSFTHQPAPPKISLSSPPPLLPASPPHTSRPPVLPPSSLQLSSQRSSGIVSTSSSGGGGDLLTPSSERSCEIYRQFPPAPITRSKRSKSALSIAQDRPDFILLTRGGFPAEPVDFLFAYHDERLNRRYYWRAASLSPTGNKVAVSELPSHPLIGAPPNRPEEKAACSGCGYCLGPDQSIAVFALKCRYHPECFKCHSCESPLGTDDVSVYQFQPHCLSCFEKLSRH